MRLQRNGFWSFKFSQESEGEDNKKQQENILFDAANSQFSQIFIMFAPLRLKSMTYDTQKAVY